MRQSRLKAPEKLDPAYYHCVTRVVGRVRLFDDEAKTEFVKVVRMYEALSGVRVITYAVMSDHVHLLVEVPQAPKRLPAIGELLQTIQKAYGKERAAAVREQHEALRRSGGKREADALIQSWLERMWNLSPFMKTMKQRFTQWFNSRHKRRGTLWEDRYRSALVEGNSLALAMTAAYIELNPVRAGLVDDPSAYAWCGSGEAAKGSRLAKAGLQTIAGAMEAGSAAKGLKAYRELLAPKEKVGTAKQIASKAKAGERLSPAELLRTRVRYFTDGAVIGGKDFVNAIFTAERPRFGPNRKDGARPMRGIDRSTGLCTLRNLQRKVFGG